MNVIQKRVFFKHLSLRDELGYYTIMNKITTVNVQQNNDVNNSIGTLGIRAYRHSIYV